MLICEVNRVRREKRSTQRGRVFLRKVEPQDEEEEEHRSWMFLLFCFDRFFLFLKRHTEKSNEKKQKSKFKSQNESDTEPKEEE